MSSMAQPRAIVLRAPGTNCDEETAAAWERAGAVAETWHVGRLLEIPDALDGFQILTIPGGFSYGDDLGAGPDPRHAAGTRPGRRPAPVPRPRRADPGHLQRVPGPGPAPACCPAGRIACAATLTHNDSGHFESRWVRLLPRPGLSPFVTVDRADRAARRPRRGEVPRRRPAGPGGARGGRADRPPVRRRATAGRPRTIPANPNGSPCAVAGVCDPTGRIFGLMPHPERFVRALHHPRWTRIGKGFARGGTGDQFPGGSGRRGARAVRGRPGRKRAFTSPKRKRRSIILSSFACASGL